MRALVWAYVVALAHGCSSPSPPSCLEMGSERWDLAYAQCAAEHAASADPKIAYQAATAAYYLASHDEALRIGSSLIFGPRAADALLLLGSSELAQRNFEHAREHLERALAMHTQTGQLAMQTRDAFQLAGVWFGLGEYRKALEAMQLARDAALRSDDRRMLVYADLASADIHRAIGDLRLAETEIERAVSNAEHLDDRMHAYFKRATVQLEIGYRAAARASFERVLEEGDPRSGGHAALMKGAHVNIASIDRVQGRPVEALVRLEAQQDKLDTMTFRFNRGIVLADLGRLAEASADLRLAEAAGPRGEWAWRVPYSAALVETRAGRADEARAACRRSIAKVTELAAKAGTYGPKVIAMHRQPHFHLIGLHAARRQWAEVLDVVATLDAHALIDSREAPSDLASTHDAPLVLPAPPRPALGDASTVVGAWRGRRLVIVVPGGARAWRLVLRDGALEGRDLGDLKELEELALSLAENPGDVARGRRLGEALLGDLPAGPPIDLLVVGPLASASLASLRVGDRLATAHLRIARVPGVLPRIARAAAPAAARAPHAAVLGDPKGDLPSSADEAAQVAARLRVDALVGPAATRAAFTAASGADLLHLSAHTKVELERGAVLVLADGPVTAADIGRLARVPRRVVLASCAGSQGTDDAGSGSLAHAFLDAGTEELVATKWTIRDADAAKLVMAFYDGGGASDPIRALAAAQQQLAGTLQAHTWASFEVLAARPALR